MTCWINWMRKEYDFFDVCELQSRFKSWQIRDITFSGIKKARKIRALIPSATFTRLVLESKKLTRSKAVAGENVEIFVILWVWSTWVWAVRTDFLFSRKRVTLTVLVHTLSFFEHLPHFILSIDSWFFSSRHRYELTVASCELTVASCVLHESILFSYKEICSASSFSSRSSLSR